MLKTVSQKIEAVLYRYGFRHREARQLVCWQILAAGVTSLAALALSLGGMWGVAYAAGALLVTVNFYQLAHFVQGIVYVKKGGVLALLLRFYFKLIVSGIVLYGLIALAKAPIPALLAGLSSVVVTVIFWSATRFAGQKVKEA